MNSASYYGNTKPQSFSYKVPNYLIEKGKLTPAKFRKFRFRDTMEEKPSKLTTSMDVSERARLTKLGNAGSLPVKRFEPLKDKLLNYYKS